MNNRISFNMTMIVSLLLGLLVSFTELTQVPHILAAEDVTELKGANFSGGLERMVPIQPNLTARPELVLPHNGPFSRSLLQTTPALTITKTADPDPVKAGAVLTYTIVVFNGGTADATDTVITDTLDSNVSFASASDGGVHDTGVVSWNTGTITTGQSITRILQVTVSSSAGGTNLSNTVEVTSTEGISDSDTITTQVTAAADLQITKTGSADPVIAGTSFTYAITVTNNGPSDASGVTITDTLPGGLTFNAAGSSGDCSANGQTVTCSAGSLTVGQTVTRTIAVNVGASVAHGVGLSNTATVAGSETDPTPANNSATENTTVNRQIDLRIDKTDSTDPAIANASFTYIITVTNNGPSDATGVTITDTLPSGLTFNSADSSGDCSAIGQNVTCSTGNLAENATIAPTIAVNVSALVADGTVLTNTAAVAGNETELILINNSADENTTINQETDLQIDKTGPADPVIAGTSFTYAITVTNNGPSHATGVTITDTLPSGLSFNSTGSSSTCSANGQTVTCSAGNLANGATVTRIIAVDVDASVAHGTGLANTATVSGNETDPVSSNNSATENTTVNRQADLELTKTDSPDPIAAFRPLDYILTVTNNGPSDAAGVVLTDTLPAGMSFASSDPRVCSVPSSGPVTCNLGTISSGNGSQVTITVNPTKVGVFTNQAEVAATDPDPDSSNNTATEDTTVSPANLSITKTDSSDPVLVERPLTYTLTIANSGPNDATNVVLTDTLPSGVVFQSYDAGASTCIHTSGIVTCNLGTLDNGDIRTIKIVVKPTIVGVIANTAEVTAKEPDPNTSNNTATENTTVNPVTDLEISKSDSADPVIAGTSFTYAITVTNNGPSHATGVTITDTLPSGLSFNSAGSNSTCSANGQTVTCSAGNLANGATVTRTIAVNVSASVAHGTVLSNTAAVAGNEADLNPANNSEGEDTTVNRQADLELEKTDSANPVIAGTSFSYNIEITNNGPSDATAVTITDTLPSGLTFDSAGSSAGCSAVDQKTVTCSAGNLANGATVTRTIAVNVSASVAHGTVLSNTAAVAGNEADLNPANNSEGEDTTVNRQADLAVTKTGSPNPVLPGTDLTYSLTVANNGPSDASGVSLADNLPGDVTFKSAPTGCTEASGTVTCSLGNLASGSISPITIVVNVISTTTGTLSNSASVTGNEFDPNSSNDTDPEETLVGDFYKTYLPIVFKPALTELSVFNNNTGGNVTFTVLGTGVSCTVPNNVTQFCGSFYPGTYDVQVISVCGPPQTIPVSFTGGPVTKRVFCK